MNQRCLSPFVQEMPLGQVFLMFTKGFTLENKPNRDRGCANGRKRVGDVGAMGEAGCEQAGESEIERSSPI